MDVNVKYNLEKCIEIQPWPHSPQGLLLMEFDCKCEADKWYSGCPDIRQRDWLDGGVDVIGFPPNEEPLSELMFCSEKSNISLNYFGIYHLFSRSLLF